MLQDFTYYGNISGGIKPFDPYNEECIDTIQKTYCCLPPDFLYGCSSTAIIDGIFEPTEERLDGLLQEVIRLTSLVGELEKITTIESNDFIPDIKDVKLASVVENVCSTFEAAFQRKNID